LTFTKYLQQSQRPWRKNARGAKTPVAQEKPVAQKRPWRKKSPWYKKVAWVVGFLSQG